MATIPRGQNFDAADIVQRKLTEEHRTPQRNLEFKRAMKSGIQTNH